MEEINKKVIGNAVSAYFLVLVSLTFLISNKKYLDHPFIKSHVKSAFALHLMLFAIWFVMSYDFFGSTTLLSYSVNTIITAVLLLGVFAGILYGMYKAHRGETVTLGEMFHHASSGKNFVTKNKSENIQESEGVIMILAHIPFLGFIVGTRNSDIPHMRDVLQLNFIATLFALLLLIVGYTSLANIIMLIYIIWSVAQSISIATQGSIVSIGLDSLPTIEEKYILQKTIIRYILNTLNKKIFVPFSEIRTQKTLERKNDEILSEKNMKSPYTYIMRNIFVLIMLFIISIWFIGWNSPALILFLFPLSYLMGHSERVAYKMPYIYDIYALFSAITTKTFHIFSRARTLKNTTKSESIKMGEKISETKKEF